MQLTAVLGAGFSRAASNSFPITDELGNQVMNHLKADGQLVTAARAYQGKRFEAWLSRLAEPQPDLSDADNLRNRELFVRVTNAIREVIADAQTRAVSTPIPWWLQKFVGCLHFLRSNVITFNYDTLVEHVLQRSWLTDENFNRAHGSDALRHMPLLAERPQHGITFGYPAASTMRLIKLHGSIDTYWVNGDSTGATIRRWDELNPSGTTLNHLLPGRVPFIVPPAAAKSSFYQNPLTRQLWQDAATAIEFSDEVALVGYSLPPTDLVSSGMFGERLSANNAQIVLVNPDPSQPCRALCDLNISKSRISVEKGCIDYVDVLERRFQPKLWYPVFDVRPTEVPVSVSVDNYPRLPVLAIRPGDDRHEVLVSVGQGDFSAEAVPNMPTADQIMRSCESVRRIRVEYPDGNSAYVAETVVGLGRSGGPESLVLHPTAIPLDLLYPSGI